MEPELKALKKAIADQADAESAHQKAAELPAELAAQRRALKEELERVREQAGHSRALAHLDGSTEARRLAEEYDRRAAEITKEINIIEAATVEAKNRASLADARLVNCCDEVNQAIVEHTSKQKEAARRSLVDAFAKTIPALATLMAADAIEHSLLRKPARLSNERLNRSPKLFSGVKRAQEVIEGFRELLTTEERNGINAEAERIKTATLNAIRGGDLP
jgi:hypothetical protein